MLERTSRFVLEVLPYLLTAVIGVIVLPQFVYSRTHTAKPAVALNGSAGMNVVERVGAEVKVTDPASWRSE